jgi:hypothetical protein
MDDRADELILETGQSSWQAAAIKARRPGKSAGWIVPAR